MNTANIKIQSIRKPQKLSLSGRIGSDLLKNRELYLMILPVIAYYILFHYKPMYGIIIAFKDYSPAKGILGSTWIGLDNFRNFFGSYYFGRILKNTFLISCSSILFEFPMPIILALLINEVRKRSFARVVQTMTYMPYFLSLVVVCGLIKDFTNSTGIVSYLLGAFGMEPANLLDKPGLFIPIYVISDIWQNAGWGSIIYLSAISSIDQQQYEAAEIDGAGHLRRVWHITLPGILPTIAILFILRMGNMMSVGFEKILLLYSPLIYDTADVISTFVYRRGILDSDFSFSSAVGLFNSVINFCLVISANYMSRKVNDYSLW